jgi:hypothetical protein
MSITKRLRQRFGRNGNVGDLQNKGIEADRFGTPLISHFFVREFNYDNYRYIS